MTDPIRMTGIQYEIGCLAYAQRVLDALWNACNNFPVEEDTGLDERMANLLRETPVPKGVQVTPSGIPSILVQGHHAMLRAIEPAKEKLNEAVKVAEEGMDSGNEQVFGSYAAEFGREVGAKIGRLRDAVASALEAGGLTLDNGISESEINAKVSRLDKKQTAAIMQKMKEHKNLFALSALTLLGYEVCHAFLSSPVSPNPVESKVA